MGKLQITSPTHPKFKPPMFFDGLSNADYHAGPGISKSQLDYIGKTPALLEWSRKCPQDADAIDALVFGEALHCRILEPARFASTYVAAPKFDMRTNVGKAGFAEWSAENEGKEVLDADTAKQLDYSFDSVMAHPTARKFFESQFVAERSYYAIDDETGVMERVRPDAHGDAFTVMGDVKSTDDIDNFFYSVIDYGYHRQEAMYCDVVERVLDLPQKFFFVAVGKRRQLGRYPTRVFILPPELVDEGRRQYRAALRTYADCLSADKFPGVEVLQIPDHYARKLAAEGAVSNP